MDNTSDKKYDKIVEYAKPISDLLIKKFDPYTYVVVTQDDVKVLCVDYGAPLN